MISIALSPVVMQVPRVCETSKPEFSLTFIAPSSEKEKEPALINTANRPTPTRKAILSDVVCSLIMGPPTYCTWHV